MGIIEGFSIYMFDGIHVIKAGIVIPPSFSEKCNCQYRLKHNGGKWKSLSLEKVRALSGFKMKIPLSCTLVPNTNKETYVDIEGTVYRFSSRRPEGYIVTQSISKEGYRRVRIKYEGKSKVIEVHILMCRAFLMEDYIERGFCCLHKDDNKLNLSLTNLEIGSYSKNNKDAYARGLNPGNGLKARGQ